MDWFFYIALAVLASSANIFVDNYVSDCYFKGREAAAQKGFYPLPFLIIGIIFLFAGGINFSNIPIHLYTLFIFSGIGSAVAGIFYYKALEVSDSTDFGIFAQLSPIFYLILGWLFLDQTINIYQSIALLIIIIAPILIIMTTKKRSRHLRIKAVLYTMLDSLIAALCSVIFVKGDADASEINFISEMGLTFIGIGIGNAIIMLLMPKWRKRYKNVVKSSRKKLYYPLSSAFILNVVHKFTRNLALVLAPSVALASAIMSSAKPIVIFFLGLLFTLLWPRFGREKLKRRTILVHLLATILVVIGIYLIKS